MAADLLWTQSSMRMWEDLVRLRGWSAGQYEKRVGDRLVKELVKR